MFIIVVKTGHIYNIHYFLHSELLISPENTAGERVSFMDGTTVKCDIIGLKTTSA